MECKYVETPAPVVVGVSGQVNRVHLSSIINCLENLTFDAETMYGNTGKEEESSIYSMRNGYIDALLTY